jgi:hypothetical protein
VTNSFNGINLKDVNSSFSRTNLNTFEKKLMIKSILFFAFFAVLGLSSCTTLHKTMREPNVRVELVRENFDLSEQVSAEATSVRILGIDWQRLLNKEQGSVEGWAFSAINFGYIPIIGTGISEPASFYALHEMMKNNPGYDVVFYPQYEAIVKRPVIGIGFIYKKTTVKATARLGKMK